VTNADLMSTLNSWLQPIAAGEPPPVSDRLIRALEAHAAASAVDVASCRRLAQRMADPAVELLLGMILEDEQRHQSLVRSMISRLHQEEEFGASLKGDPVPSGFHLTTAEAVDEMAVIVRGLIRNEHEGARHLRHLARQEPALYEGLYPLLLETIARDSEKHATILRYLLGRVERSSRT
jgi:hypothetical protein